MYRFALAVAAYAARLILPITIGATAVGLALLLGILPLDSAAYPRTVCKGWACMQETHRIRYDWQIPAALLIGVLGLGLAALIALWNRRRPQSRPVPPVSEGWQAQGSASMLWFYVALAAYSGRRALPFVITIVVVCAVFCVGVIPLDIGNWPSRSGWQTPVAVLIGVIGLGLAFGVAVWNRWHPQARPLPPLPAGWQTGA